MKLSDTQILYVRSMGKALRVSAIFTDDTAANAYMEKHNDQGVVACFGQFILLAHMWDKGETIVEAA